MENLTTKQLLETYYKGLAEKTNWDSVIADDFRFVGGDMTKTTPIIGKSAYIEVINRFSNLFDSMHVKRMIIDNDGACVIANYDYKFPNGAKINGDVAEIWTVKDGKLDSLTIYFDTLTFSLN